MTNEFINEILEREGESPILLEGCVLNITNGRNVIYSLWGDTDYVQKNLEIFYADNHTDVIWKGIVETKQDLETVLIKTLKI